MRGLTIIVATADPGRFRTALTLAAAHAALGHRTRLFLDAAAVPLAHRDAPDPEADRHTALGLPTLAELQAEAHALGVTLILCQTGLQLAELTPAEVDPRATFGGMLALIQSLRDDRLLLV